MKWNKDTYTISTDVAKELVKFLHDNWFCTTSDGDSDNNPEVIELSKRFEAVLEAQEQYVRKIAMTIYKPHEERVKKI